MPKGQMIDAKSAETRMLIERIDKMAEVTEFTIGPAKHSQRFQRTCPRLTPRGIVLCQLLKIRSYQIRLPRNGDPSAGHV